MIWGWENPLFFCFAGAVVLLLILYLLKSRGQTFFSQALFLWEGESGEEKSSSCLTLRKLPLSFYLEAAALMLMVCGGAHFFIVDKEKFPPAVLLINNSYSMTPETQLRGEKALEKYLARFPRRQVIRVLCGRDQEQIGNNEKGTKGRANAFDAPRAVAWAKKSFPGAEIILVSDRIPPGGTPEDVTLICCGRAGENFAITAADVKENRVLLEAGSFSDVKRTLHFKVNGKTFETFELAPGERKVFNFQVAETATFLKFSLESPVDHLGYDDHVTLINQKSTPVTFSYGVLSGAEKKALDAVLKENPEFRYDEKKCELLFTSEKSKQEKNDVSRMIFHGGGQSVLESNPPFFMVNDELMTGLFNTSLVWAFTPGIALPGRGLVYSSSAPLISFAGREHRKFDLHLNVDLKYSNLPDLPFWPGLFCNLARFCRKCREGVAQVNVKCGEEFVFHTAPGCRKLHFKGELEEGSFPVMGGKALVRLKGCGIYTLNDGRNTLSVAVNPELTEVSDLRRNCTFFSESKLLLERKKSRIFAGTVFIAGALFFLALNGFFNSRSRKK